jgi:hypothetical protein
MVGRWGRRTVSEGSIEAKQQSCSRIPCLEGQFAVCSYWEMVVVASQAGAAIPFEKKFQLLEI